ncbi:zinc finger protein [Corchorus capsularis]|uniref:Zinc finger protein n=1 Tax=Corchorus capsularis TaxID=210143 RepID=A0A1R3GQ81_COCAP|nr:zinc finger protein [Corchorus capsularis]
MGRTNLGRIGSLGQIKAIFSFFSSTSSSYSQHAAALLSDRESPPPQAPPWTTTSKLRRSSNEAQNLQTSSPIPPEFEPCLTFSKSHRERLQMKLSRTPFSFSDPDNPTTAST